MPKIKCPIPDCEYETADLEAAIVASLLTVHSTIHSSLNAPTAKIEKVKRPSISAAGTSEEWSYFMSRWSDYVSATKIEGRDKVVQLLECCDEPLRKDLTRSTGGSLTDKTEETILSAIKKLAVREENTMVARVTLHNMRQDRDEPVRNFSAKLRGQAGVCKFVITCPNCNHEVNYTDTIVRDVLARGIADPDIQLDLLGDKNQNMTLEEVTQFMEAKEAGKRSASRLLDTNAAATTSCYKRTKQIALKDKNETCSYCGKKGHGRHAPARTRKTECPAYGHKCGHCNKDHHLEALCRSKDKEKLPTASTDTHSYEGGVFESLCVLSDIISNHHSNKSIALDHHLYDHLSDTWIRKRSKPQPFINLIIKSLPEDHKALGFSLNAPQRTIKLPAMADTGCQSCPGRN
ncbi:uncharacterized protein LOC134248350 [Saccostrea cucullata]|uniref:uncharacterized protein LOC134248350 n=1 Tax=Saccostrea cuccullata TaxID=36930 RepID=UPI002ED5D450